MSTRYFAGSVTAIKKTPRENTQRTRSENKFNNLLCLLREPLAFSAVNSSLELFNILLNQLLPPINPVSPEFAHSK